MAQPYGADSQAAAVAAEPRRTAITARAAMPYRFSGRSAPKGWERPFFLISSAWPPSRSALLTHSRFTKRQEVVVDKGVKRGGFEVRWGLQVQQTI